MSKDKDNENEKQDADEDDDNDDGNDDDEDVRVSAKSDERGRAHGMLTYCLRILVKTLWMGFPFPDFNCVSLSISG
jgi:hypothetical protein